MAAHDEHMEAKQTNDEDALLDHLENAQNSAKLSGEAAAKAKEAYEAAHSMN
jgi:hypothetical protein